MVLPNRSLLDQALTQLQNDVLRLGSMVESAIEESVTLLQSRDVEKALSLIANDVQLNLVRYQIETEALRVLATQQPAARDLRQVLAAIHIAIELERMGDHAVGIARLVKRLRDDPVIINLHRLPKMAKRAQQMVHDGLSAYVTRDAEMAHALIKSDDKLDKQYRKLFQETVMEMQNEALIRPSTFLLWAGHNLERIGDRATNIGERVIFMVTGRFVEIDPGTEGES